MDTFSKKMCVSQKKKTFILFEMVFILMNLIYKILKPLGRNFQNGVENLKYSFSND